MKKYFQIIAMGIAIIALLTNKVGVNAQGLDNEYKRSTKSTIGTLWVFASPKGDGSSSTGDGFNTGHCFLMFKNTSASTVRVGYYYVAPGKTITFGTRDTSVHSGLWYNSESYRSAVYGAYPNRVSISMYVTQGNIDTINSVIETMNTWNIYNNCSWFASVIWNLVSTNKVSAGIPYTPANMVASIKTKANYQTGLYIPYSSEIHVFHCLNNHLNLVRDPSGILNIDEGLFKD